MDAEHFIIVGFAFVISLIFGGIAWYIVIRREDKKLHGPKDRHRREDSS